MMIVNNRKNILKTRFRKMFTFVLKIIFKN